MVTVNGKSYEGNSINIVNGQILIDGKPVGEAWDTPENQGQIRIEVTGNLSSLCVDSGIVTVNGDVHGDVSADMVTVGGSVKGTVSADMVGSGSHCGHTTVIPSMTINA